MYLPFARKYRPGNFEEVIGQDSIVSKLKSEILSGRLHHAYLFSGPRGVGKTSMARIVAKALNCEKGPTVSICGKCQSCGDIAKGSSLDVIEIDAASNRGIDDIRQLRENVKLTPAYSRYKIYIIDEVHQITKDGFNALLKTLEEPPAHVKFIFATTEPQKVPVTILSRCQRFEFGFVGREDIIKKLKKIARREQLKNVDKDIFSYVSRACGGSIRDAESLFDQIVPLIEEGKTLRDIFELMGDIDSEEITAFIRAVASSDARAALSTIASMADKGYDLGRFLKNSIEYLRYIILAKVGRKVLERIGKLPEQDLETFCALAKANTARFFLKTIDYFIEVKQIAKTLDNLRNPLE